MVDKLDDSSVSVIMPAFKTGKFVEAAIRSVLDQTHQNLELIIVDDNSGDNTLAVIEKAAGGDERVKIIASNTNVGVAKSRNKAIAAATGRYIAFLDSDDVWYAQKLEYQLAFMKEHSAAFSFTSYDVMDENGQYLYGRTAPQSVTYRDFLRCCPIGCLTVVYDSHLLGKHFNPEMRKRQDWATWLNILKQGGEGKGLSVRLASYRLREGSLSAKKRALFGPIWHLYRKNAGLSKGKSAFYISIYFLNSIFRKYIPGFANKIHFI